MKILDDIEQGTPEWFAAKAGVVSSSSFGAVMSSGRGGNVALVRKQYIHQVATERITKRSADESPNTYWMAHGKETEAVARELYEFETCNRTRPIGFAYLDDKKLVGTSTDSLVNDDDPNPGVLEIKCPKLSTHIEYLFSQTLPNVYKPQAQGELWITGRQWCDFVSYNDKSHIPLFVHRVQRDEEYIIRLKSAVGIFLTEVDEMETKLRSIAT